MPLAKLLLTLPIAILLASCAMTTGTAGIETSDIQPIAHAGFCQIARPITWSTKDTPETVVQVKEHNAAGHAGCGWLT